MPESWQLSGSLGSGGRIEDSSFFACETFSEHLVIPPGETREVKQRFTILRDARGWCRRLGIPLPRRTRDGGRGS